MMYIGDLLLLLYSTVGLESIAALNYICLGTEQNRFGRKTDEIAKFGI